MVESFRFLKSSKIKNCIGCGFCCLTIKCSLCKDIDKDDKNKQCSSLYWKDGRYWCKEIETQNEEVLKILWVNEGCFCNSPWRENVQLRE